jgi:hypothetical protein
MPMPNRITALDVHTTRFDPLEAEVTATVLVDSPEACLRIRGQLCGPRSPYAETLEIAYPFKPLPMEEGLLKVRAIIPEANFWSPRTPLLYEAVIELLTGDQVIDSRRALHGLRHVVLNRKGLALNGQRVRLNARMAATLSDHDAQQWRKAGINTLIAPVALNSADLWNAAERLGFFVLGELDGADDELLWYAEEVLSRRVSVLGWVLPQRLTREPQLWHNAMLHLHGERRDMLIGMRIEDLPLGVPPGHVSFIVCDEQRLTELGEATLPRLILARRGDMLSDLDTTESDPRVLGRTFRA